MTSVHAAMKSWAYTSAYARKIELEPNTKKGLLP
jgi:hypothetical protein